MKEKFLKTCDHIGIITNNYRKLVSFYTGKLEFTKEKEERLSKSIMRSIFGLASEGKFTRLVSGYARIEIFCITSGSVKKRNNETIGYNHWALRVKDKDEFVRKIMKKEVKIIHIKRNDHSVYFIKDPDGNRIEIID